jgi:hypothetical protein
MDVEIRVRIKGDAASLTKAQVDTLQNDLATQAGASMVTAGFTVDSTVVNSTESETEDSRTREVDVTIS